MQAHNVSADLTQNAVVLSTTLCGKVYRSSSSETQIVSPQIRVAPRILLIMVVRQMDSAKTLIETHFFFILRIFCSETPPKGVRQRDPDRGVRPHHGGSSVSASGGSMKERTKRGRRFLIGALLGSAVHQRPIPSLVNSAEPTAADGCNAYTCIFQDF